MNPQPIPHNREAEEATIGAVMINPDIFAELFFLKHDDFYLVRNQFIWEALTRLSDRREPIDLLTVCNELDGLGKLNDCGGPAYLTSLINQVPSSLNAVSYARMVGDDSTRRKLIYASNKIVQAAYGDTDISQLQEMAKMKIDEAIQTRDEEKTIVSALSKVYDRAYDNAKRLENNEQINVGLTTGFADLDRLLLGIEDEESVLVAGRPGTGKTAFVLNIAAHVVLNLGKRVAVFSQEMSDEEVARRLISADSEIDSQKIKTGAMTAHEWGRFNNAIEGLERGGIYISDSTSLTPSKLRARCLQLQRSGGLDLVIIDYLQLMNAGMKMENRTREVGYISRSVKMLTKELHTPIISAAQLSRAGEQRADRRPVLSDLRDAGDLEQDANTVIFLHRPNKDDKNRDVSNVTNVIVEKRRDGKTGDVDLIFKGEYTKFVNSTTRIFSPNRPEYAESEL